MLLITRCGSAARYVQRSAARMPRLLRCAHARAALRERSVMPALMTTRRVARCFTPRLRRALIFRFAAAAAY